MVILMNKDNFEKSYELHKHLKRLIKITECLCFLPIGCYSVFLCIYPSYKYVQEQDLPTINL